MLKYTYTDIADLLMHGREIEFVYKGRECAITNHAAHVRNQDRKKSQTVQALQ